MFDTVKNSLGSNWPQRTPTLNIEWGQIEGNSAGGAWIPREATGSLSVLRVLFVFDKQVSLTSSFLFIHFETCFNGNWRAAFLLFLFLLLLSACCWWEHEEEVVVCAGREDAAAAVDFSGEDSPDGHPPSPGKTASKKPASGRSYGDALPGERRRGSIS